ncbi:MAG: hypothetical protein P8163_19375 [Candidatus Thiodiazotropha sp.]
MSIHIKGGGPILNTHILNHSVEKNSETTNIHTIKSQLIFGNNKRSENSAQQLHNKNIKVNNIDYSKSQCATNLNITKMHIDKMHSEILNKLYNRNVIKNHSLFKIDPDNGKYQEQSHHEIEEFDEPALSELDVYHIGLIKDLYLNVEKNNPCFSHYVIIVIYETIKNTKLINKQLLTAIPIENDIPRKSISEIAIINDSGELKKYTQTICFHNGGLTYTDDWLKIQQAQKLNTDSTFFKFEIEYRNKILKGIGFNNVINTRFSLNNSTIYIPNFSTIWC